MYFARLTVVTYGECSAGEVQKYVNCKSVQGEIVHCPVEGMGTTWTATSMSIKMYLCYTSGLHYGTTNTTVWIADGCRAVFEICGEALTTTISEISGPSQTSISQLTSTAATILNTQATTVLHSDSMATSTADHDSKKTDETTKGFPTSGLAQLTTRALSTPKLATEVENNTTMLSETTTSTLTEQKRASTTSP